MSIFYFIYLHIFFLFFIFYFMVNILYNVVNRLYTMINKNLKIKYFCKNSGESDYVVYKNLINMIYVVTN